MPRHGPRRPDCLEKAERRLHAQRRFSWGCRTPTARQGATHAHTVPAAEARLTEETPRRVLAERDGRTCGASRAGEGVAQAQLDSYAERCGRERRRAPSWRYCAASCGERRSARRLSRRPVRWVDAVRDGARGPGALRSPRARGSRREPAAYRRSSAARPSRSRCGPSPEASSRRRAASRPSLRGPSRHPAPGKPGSLLAGPAPGRDRAAPCSATNPRPRAAACRRAGSASPPGGRCAGCGRSCGSAALGSAPPAACLPAAVIRIWLRDGKPVCDSPLPVLVPVCKTIGITNHHHPASSLTLLIHTGFCTCDISVNVPSGLHIHCLQAIAISLHCSKNVSQIQA